MMLGVRRPGVTLAVQALESNGLIRASYGSLTVLDVQGFPLMLNWYVVHRRTKRLPPVAQAFKNFLLADGAHLIDQALGVRSVTRAVPRTASRSK